MTPHRGIPSQTGMRQGYERDSGKCGIGGGMKFYVYLKDVIKYPWGYPDHLPYKEIHRLLRRSRKKRRAAMRSADRAHVKMLMKKYKEKGYD